MSFIKNLTNKPIKIAFNALSLLYSAGQFRICFQKVNRFGGKKTKNKKQTDKKQKTKN